MNIYIFFFHILDYPITENSNNEKDGYDQIGFTVPSISEDDLKPIYPNALPSMLNTGILEIVKGGKFGFIRKIVI
jgi:hypothetical protein